MRMLRLMAPLASLALFAAPGTTPTTAPTTTEMALTSADGFALKGTLSLPAAKGKVPVVILAHQFRADRTGWAPLAERLAARGIGTLALDLRGHGASTKKDSLEVAVTGDFMASAKAVGFSQIPADLAEVAAWLRKQPGVDGRRIGLAGASVGALSVLLAAPEVKALAVLSLSPGGIGAFPADTRERMKAAQLRSRTSTLVLASTGDKEAAENAMALKDLPGVSLNLAEGDAHGFAYFKDRADLMAVFFGEYLTYHRLGKTYASGGKKPVAPGNLINDQTLAEKMKAEAPK